MPFLIHPHHPTLVCSGKDPIFGYLNALHLCREMIGMHSVQILFDSRPVSTPEIFNEMLRPFCGVFPSGMDRESMLDILDTLLDYGWINREPAGLNQMMADFIDLIEMRVMLEEEEAV